MTPPTAADSDFRALREQLVEELQGAGHLQSEPLADAFQAVPRHVFLPELSPEQAYRDEAHVTKRSADGWPISSSSQPTIMAIMLKQLDLMPGQRVLEIGAGTGYNAALLRCLVGPHGRVVTVEIDPQLARKARAALRRSGCAARVVVGDGREGFAAGAPYDRIIVTASVAEIPNAWLDQLRPGGRLGLPLQLGADLLPHVIPALELRDGILRSVALTWGGFMPLHGGDGGQQGPRRASRWASGPGARTPPC